MRRVISPRVIGMWSYPAASIKTATWSLFDLSQRVQAAEQLGYGVQLRWSETDGLVVEYVEKPPSPPGWY